MLLALLGLLGQWLQRLLGSNWKASVVPLNLPLSHKQLISSEAVMFSAEQVWKRAFTPNLLWIACSRLAFE